MNRVTPLILAVALFMEMMDATVIATSLPAIAYDIGAEPIALKLAMTAYLVALAIFIPISGWMADRFGANNVFRWAIFVFMVGSLSCALSDSLATFVASRFLQGMGGAMMTPLARLVILRTTPRSDLVTAMAWLTMPALIGPMAGPPIGGFLTTYLSWHWIFLINIPIGIVGIVAATIYLPKINSEPLKPLDWLGFGLLGTCFSGVLFGLSVISLPALPPMIGVAVTAIGLASGAAYLIHARNTPDPLLDPKLLKISSFSIALTTGGIFRLGVGATPFLLPLMFQLSFGLTPFETGMIMLFGPFGAIVAKIGVGYLYARFGFKRVLSTLALGSSLFLTLMANFTADSSVIWMGFVVFLGGVLRAMYFTGASVLTYADIEANDNGQATALFSVTQQVSFALGVALAGGALEFLSHQHEGAVNAADFSTAFYVVATVSALAIIPFFFLAPDAGSAISGHKKRTADPSPVEGS